MNKFYCLIAAIILNLVCNAQNDSVVKRERKTHFLFYFGCVYPYRVNDPKFETLNFRGPGSGSWRNVTYNTSDEIGAMSTSFGFNIESREPNKNIFFKTGLNHTQINFQTKPNTTFYITSGGDYTFLNIRHDTTQNCNIKKRQNFITIPFELNYHLPLDDSYLSFGGGTEVNLLYQNKIIESWKYENKLRENKYNLRPSFGIFFSFSLNCGIFLELDENKAIGFELVFQPLFDPSLKYTCLASFGNIVLKL